MLIFERKNTVGGASAFFVLVESGGRVSVAEAGGGCTES